jgi:hypothetical protein
MVIFTVYFPVPGATVTVYFPDEMVPPLGMEPVEEVTDTEPELVEKLILPLPETIRVTVFDPDCVLTLTEMPEFTEQLDTLVIPVEVPEIVITVPLVAGHVGTEGETGTLIVGYVGIEGETGPAGEMPPLPLVHGRISPTHGRRQADTGAKRVQKRMRIVQIISGNECRILPGFNFQTDLFISTQTPHKSDCVHFPLKGEDNGVIVFIMYKSSCYYSSRNGRPPYLVMVGKETKYFQ